MAHKVTIRRIFVLGSSLGVALGVLLIYALARSAASRVVQQNEYLPSPLEIHLIGQREWLAGSTASLRVIVRNHDKDEPIANAQVRVSLKHAESGWTVELFNERTNRHGTVEGTFKVPPWAVGRNEISVTVSSPIGEDKIVETVTVKEEVRILLTTDKPLYQPSQIIHMRALCLNAATLKPSPNIQVSFEVEDPKGNKVFRKRERTSQFGIANADFQLADEINLGNYTVRAIAQVADAKGGLREVGEATQTVKVDRYVLPKFKVELETSKRFYLPGEEVNGTVKANYFFGKPVSDGEVIIKLSTFDVGWNQIAELRGRTDDGGVYKFSYRLPTHFVGLPLEQGKALLKIDVQVTDKAEHEEQITETLPIAKDAISIVVIPDSQTLAKGIQNTLFIVTTYPDGMPAETSVRVTGGGINWVGKTDETGIAELQFVPSEGRISIAVEAIDKQGNKGRLTRTLEGEAIDEAILLRTSKVIARVGETVQLTVLSPRRGGTVYIDAIRGRQTVLTRSLEMNGTRNTIPLTLTEQMVGTLTLHAYRITKAGHIIRDTKIIYVNPAEDLRIAIKPDKNVYLPGKEARVDLSVSDTSGRPMLAALGITAVDESVYALQEMQPGLEKVYFMLERELLKPKYQIRGFEPTIILLKSLRLLPLERPQPATIDERKERAARVLFAAAMPNLHTMYVNTWQVRAQKLRGKWIEHAQKVYTRLLNALEEYRRRRGSYPEQKEIIDALIRERLISRQDVLDPLGREYRAELIRGRFLQLTSAGPDGDFGTNDDVRMPQESIWFTRILDRGAAVQQLGLGAFGAERAALAGPQGPVGPRGPEGPPGPKAAAGFGGGAPEAQQIRIRQFFPETLVFIPQLITDERGRASLNLAMADSITTWRLTVMASSLRGLLGSAVASLRVFQDFFVDIDLPVSLTQGDEVSIPIAIYNYLPTAQTVRLQLQPEEWFEPLSSIEQTVLMNAGDVGVVRFPIRVKNLGTNSMTVIARGEKMSDAIKRQVLVIPNGKEVWESVSDTLKGSVKKVVKIPPQAIDDASTILVRIYGGGFSQVVDGLDKLLRMPFGCFEQTSSVTYPNVLVLDYMKRTKQINPEIQMKAEQYINLGYQRLLTFEVKGGGFSWFGDPPAHEVLTAYGLMEFNDMSKVFEIDRRVIERTSKWLISRQRQDGSWEPPGGGIREGVINRQTDVLRTTAYIAWALSETLTTIPDAEVKRSVGRAVEYMMGRRVESVDDAYALAVIANAFVGWDRNNQVTIRIIDRLAKMANVEGDIANWRTSVPTFTHSKGITADLETTALATYALLKARSHPDIVNKALTYLVRSKDAYGTWHSTQATIWSLKALLLATEGATSEIDAHIAIKCNGKDVAKLRITPEDSDIVRQVDLKRFVREGDNEVTFEWQGKGAAVYQVATRYYLPWDIVRGEEKEPLDISVDYDRRELSVNDIVRCEVSVRNNQPIAAKMVIVDVGIPPGFQILSEDLAKLVEQKVIQKFSLTGRQVIIYLDEIRPQGTVTISYRLRATYPIRASSGAAVAYEYYAPEETKVEAKPVKLVVR
ncbi:MAG: MG2 domain-containing protein [Armatimonadota bacterium]|nr:MG2 domain-containing protein [Armatimonadota bacterium]MCX7776512.1 MG2 domain-containing protein [Armatimonadota bacterium]MDW8024309.1 MG2 domain-containing protein [Armatimonadota bacterium]